MKAGQLLTDGTVTWIADDVRDGATSDTSAGANNPIYGRSDTVQPPAFAMIAQIKY